MLIDHVSAQRCFNVHNNYKIKTIPKSRKGVSPPQGTILSGFHHVPYGLCHLLVV